MTLNETEEIERALRLKIAKVQDRDGLLRGAAEAIQWLREQLAEAEHGSYGYEFGGDDL
jgi:hypothetical protein